MLALRGRGLCENFSCRKEKRADARFASVEDEGAQARYVVERVLENREADIALKAQAVLFRASHHSAVLELEPRAARSRS